MIRFFHVADIHFGVENYGRIDPKTGIHTRLLDFKHSLDTCIDRAVSENIDAFVFAGDAYKTAHPTPTQQRLLMQSFFKLYRAGIPVVIVVGNHDNPLSFGKAHALDVFRELPVDGFYVFSQPDLVVIPTKSGPLQVVGVPWPTRHLLLSSGDFAVQKTSEITEYLARAVSDIVSHYAVQLDPNMPAIVVGHLTVSNGIFSGSEKCAVLGSDPLILVSQLALPEYDYVALGHLHRHQNLNAGGYPAVVYAGSIDRVDFGERREQKGYCDVRIEVGIPPEPSEVRHYATRANYEFIPLATRPFVQIEVTLRDDAGSHTEQLIAAIGNHDIDQAIVKMVYHVPAGMQDVVDLAALHRALQAAAFVVGIFPVRAPDKRVRRTSVHTSMDAEKLLDAYVDTRPNLMASRERLLARAREIIATVDERDTSCGAS